MELNTSQMMKEHSGTPLKIKLTRIIYMVALMMVLIVGQLPRYETILKEKRKKFIHTQLLLGNTQAVVGGCRHPMLVPTL